MKQNNIEKEKIDEKQGLESQWEMKTKKNW